MGDMGDGGELRRVNSYQWPSGHIGHLSEGQTGALERFKTLCAEKGYYAPAGDKKPPTHDDETLLRYLRARKFVPQEAFVQFKDTEDWRKENQLDRLYETIDINEYEETRRLYPQWTGRRDKRGIPFYVYEISAVDSKAVSAYTSSKDRRKLSTNTKTPWKMLKLFALYENLCRFVLPMCSAIPDRPHSETPISQSNNIVDLGGVGFTKLWNLRNHMSDASKLATSYYPETLDRIFVIGAPSFFPTIWGWAQRWFDPITVSKIFILTPKNMTETLEKFVDIENLPTKYGGKLEWKFGDMPNIEPAIANNLRWKEVAEQRGHQTLPIGPIKWQYNDDGDLVALAVGTEEGQPRKRVLAALHPEVGVAQLALSPGRSSAPIIIHPTTAHIPTTTSNSPPPDATRNRMSDGEIVNVDDNTRTSVHQTSEGGKYTLPTSNEASSDQDGRHTIGTPLKDTRQGTSSTRFEQQKGTHAEGQLADGTPATIESGVTQDRPAVMDPRTVGQAPKEHLPPDTEEPPSAIEKAKDYANQALEQARQLPTTVMNAVGMGEKKEEEPVEPAAKKEDPEIDNMAGKNVEEFLRSQTASTTDPSKTAQAKPDA